MLSINILHSLDLLSTVIFASSGALLAREQRRSGLCGLFYAAFTALGGGTIRDILLSQTVFWRRSPDYLLLTLTVGIVVFYGVPLIASPRACLNHLNWGDIVGLASFTVVGAQVVIQLPTFDLTVPLFWVLPSMMGLVTAVGGGFVRDILTTRQPSYIAQHPAYVCAAVLGGFVYSHLVVCFKATASLAVIMAIATVMLVASGILLRGYHKLNNLFSY